MMKLPRTLIAGGALILLTNAVVLAGVAYNRNETPESSLRLTQRELELPLSLWRMERDNSGISLELNWRVGSEKREQNDFGFAYPSGNWGMPAWLDKTKLAELGFDVSRPANTPDGSRYYGKLLAKEVLLVLELNGSAYQRELERAREYAGREAAFLAGNPDNKEFAERAKYARDYLKKEENDNSRLFVIDAGLDLAKLRAAYPDRSRYAIVHGQVHPRLVREEKKEVWIGANISKLSVDHVNVPAAYRPVFEYSPTKYESKYEVNVAYGKRLEPWITDASKSLAVK